MSLPPLEHHHPDTDTLTVGCLACITRTKHDQDRATIAAAPVRRCKWTVHYFDGWKERTTSFTIDVRVPAGWEPWQVDEEYASETGHPFIASLPARWSDEKKVDSCMNWRDWSLTIGGVVPEAVAAPDMPSLFELEDAS